VPLLAVALLRLLLPVAPLRRVLTRWLMHIAENWVSVNALIFGSVNDVKWDLRGFDQLSSKEWYLAMVNHQTWVDIIVLQTVLNRRIPLLKFFIKKQLFWFPLLGLAFWALDMPFMQRHPKSYLAKHPEKKGSDFEATRRACRKFRYAPTSVINFLEGTRFSEEKRQKRGSPFRNLLPPRAGGMALALSSMGDMFTAILDITIVYPNRTTRFWELACGELEYVVVDIRRRPVDDWMVSGDYVNDREHRRRVHQWLRRTWEEKDRRIDELRAEHRAT
jgi:1-acyl-sn-glycerol-3-phosphate acyltransferase